ncbi:MAG TPA: ROK family protein [archaeon]|nr:ROK family protein [archaeon]
MRFDFGNVIPADHKIMRLINRANVINIIREKAPISRVEISKLTGLKKSTISSIVSDLIGEALIYEDSLGESSVGRKPIFLRLNERGRLVGVIDVRHVKTTVAICDLGRHVLKKKVIRTESGDGKRFFSNCGKILSDLARLYSVPLTGVGVSVPALANHTEGIIYRDDTHNWMNINVYQLVGQHVGCPVFAENDAKAGALAQLWFADDTGNVSNFVFLLICEGIGVGMVMNRTLYHGVHSLDGQFGLQLIKINGKWEEITRDNTWEDNSSDLGVVRRYCEYSGNIWENNLEDIERNMEQVINLACNGEHHAVRALKETARYLAVGIANINNGLGPERIIIAGKIVQVWDLVFPEIIHQMERQTIFQVVPFRELIVPSSLNSPTFDGAQALVLQDLFKSYKIS